MGGELAIAGEGIRAAPRTTNWSGGPVCTLRQAHKCAILVTMPSNAYAHQRTGPPIPAARFRLGGQPYSGLWPHGAQEISSPAGFCCGVLAAYPGVLALSDEQALPALERFLHSTTPLRTRIQSVPLAARTVRIGSNPPKMGARMRDAHNGSAHVVRS